MRVHVLSDLHLEFGPLDLPEEVRSGALADLVLLAGDIDVKRRAIPWAAKTFAQPVCLIGGNHEVYRDSLFANIAASRRTATLLSKNRGSPVRFLEQEVCMFETGDGVLVRIVAATLWTDFEVFGAGERERAMALAGEDMNDYRLIRIHDAASRETRTLHPSDSARIHAASRQFLERELAAPFHGLTIVMTHHAPSLYSVPPHYQDNLLTAAYAFDAEALIERYQPQLWVHGHVHSSSDYWLRRTRIVCNPRGYYPDAINPAFDPALTIELG